MTEFNGTNPLLDALGDQPTIRDVTINNNTSFKIVEPLTGLQIQTETIVRVHGEVAFQQIQNNIVQLNELKQEEAVTSTDVIVNEETAQWTLTNCAISNGILSYTGGTIDFNWPYNSNPALSLTKTLAENEEFSFELPSYDIGGLNPVSEVLIFISSHDTVIDAFNDRPMYPTPPATPTVALWDFTQNGSNSGLSIVSPEGPESEYPLNSLKQ